MKFNQEKIKFFSELITCSHDLYYWCYDPELTLLDTSCPESTTYSAVFSISGCKEALLAYLPDAEKKPYIMTDTMGLMWIAAFEHDRGNLTRIHMIGPAFIADVTRNSLDKKLSHKGLSLRMKNSLINSLQLLPVLSVAIYFQYGQMLNYTVTGEKVPVGEFQYQAFSTADQPDREGVQPRSAKDSHGTWAAEQELMQVIEEGNLDYHEVLSKIAVTGSSGHFFLGDPLREAKDTMLVFVILSSRAAMRANLSPEIAYTLSDFYINSIENAASISEIQETGHTMFHDYVFRVNELKKNSQISKQVQDACSYIQIHSAEKLETTAIASHVGYTEYYFTKKFKRETGQSVKDYIKETKIKRAQIMLKTETGSVQEISDALNFCSQSYFTETFRKITGMTPAQFRSSNL